MKGVFILFCIFASQAFGSVTALPWPEGLPCARHVGVNEHGRLLATYTEYRAYARGLSETIDIFQRLHRDPNLKLSFEHLQYTMSFYTIMRPVDYAVNCESFAPLDSATLTLLELQQQRRLNADDFRGGDWVHMISGIGQDEVICLNYVERGGQVTGCGDLWQGGITNDEVVCHEGKNYLKCQMDCITRIHRSAPTLQPGFCQ